MDNYIEKIKNKNIHIVGVFGAEGSAVLEFMAAHGVRNITAHDFSADEEELRQNFFKTHLWIRKKADRLVAYERAHKLPSKLNLKDKYLEGVREADIIFAPSSWRLYKPNFPALIDAYDKDIEFSSLTKLYFELAEGKIISVTGTKGKGTTSRLIYEILCHPEAQSAEGSRVLRENFAMPRDSSPRISGTQNDSIGMVYFAGNDRRAGQELEKISRMDKDGILVLETSNRQLMNDLGRSPDIGVITNISPDHIDEHGSFEKYIEAKKSLFKYSKKGDIAVLNFDNEITRSFGGDLIKRGVDTYFFSREEILEQGIFIEKDKICVKIEKKECICDISDITLLGGHNLENILAAALAAYLAGAKTEMIRKAIKNFQGLTHRNEFIGEYNGVKFYDDMASTNPDSTIAAINAVIERKAGIDDGKLFLIMGGDDKGMDYTGLIKKTNEHVDRVILLPGTGSEKLKYQFNFKAQMSSASGRIKENQLIIKECNNFMEAMEIIKGQTKTGDIVLISPACAHFQARCIDVLNKPLRNIIVEKFK